VATWRGQRRGQRLRQIDLTGDETTGAKIVRVALTAPLGPATGRVSGHHCRRLPHSKYIFEFANVALTYPILLPGREYATPRGCYTR